MPGHARPLPTHFQRLFSPDRRPQFPTSASVSATSRSFAERLQFLGLSDMIGKLVLAQYPSGRKPTFLLRGIMAVVVEKVTEIVGRVAASEGLEVVDVEWKGGGNNRLLRIFIDKPGGISHADCETVSHQVGAILDVEDVIPAHYTLEVSSPGLDRKLLKPADYERFAGKKAKVRLSVPVDRRSSFVGRLAGFDEGQASLDVEGGGRIRFAPADVVSARLRVEI